MQEQLIESASDSSASTIHLAVQGLHNTLYRFRRQQLLVHRILIVILVLLCIFNLLQFALLFYIASQLCPVFGQHARSIGG